MHEAFLNKRKTRNINNVEDRTDRVMLYI